MPLKLKPVTIACKMLFGRHLQSAIIRKKKGSRSVRIDPDFVHAANGDFRMRNPIVLRGGRPGPDGRAAVTVTIVNPYRGIWSKILHCTTLAFVTPRQSPGASERFLTLPTSIRIFDDTIAVSFSNTLPLQNR